MDVQHTGESSDEEDPMAAIHAAITGLQAIDMQASHERGPSTRSKTSKGKWATPNNTLNPQRVALLSRTVAGTMAERATPGSTVGTDAGKLAPLTRTHLHRQFRPPVSMKQMSTTLWEQCGIQGYGDTPHLHSFLRWAQPEQRTGPNGLPPGHDNGMDGPYMDSPGGTCSPLPICHACPLDPTRPGLAASSIQG